MDPFPSTPLGGRVGVRDWARPEELVESERPVCVGSLEMVRMLREPRREGSLELLHRVVAEGGSHVLYPPK